MHKLKKHSQFQRVYKKGRSYKEPNIGLCVLTNDLSYNRMGVSVGSKNVQLSVRRNRCKRLLLETHRLTEERLKKGFDMVLISKRDISRSKLNDIMNEVLRLYKKCGILK